MLENGLIDEVKHLMEMGYTRDLNSMQGIGYKEVIDYLDGKCTFDETVEIIKQSSRRYAKRQMTWFRRDGRINYLPGIAAVDEAKKLIDEYKKSIHL